MSGIYSFRNKVNNHIYIGSTTLSFKERWYKHVYDLDRNKHNNIHLQRAYNKYGKDAFVFDIIEEITNKNEILAVEQYYIDVFYGSDCYNISKKASFPDVERKPLTKEALRSISEKAKQRMRSPEYQVMYSTVWKQLGIKNKENMSTVGKNNAKTWNGFVSPDGLIYTNIYNLTDFCKIHDLNMQHMSKVSNGIRKSHKGWRKYHGA